VSALIDAVRRRHRLVRDGGEQGTSLLELIVGMSIMTVCGAVFLGSAVTLSQITAKTQAVTNTASQTNLSYLALDKTVRYASAIAPPGKGPSGNWYVEFRDTDTSGTSNKEVCTQLSINNSTQRLQQRTWTAGTTPAPLPAFRQIGTGFTNGTAALTAPDRPFILVPDPVRPDPLHVAPVTTNHQQLVVTLVSQSGSANGSSSSSTSSFTLTALNSTGSTATGSVCQEVGRP
jgi:hypothetical protein